VVINVSIQFAAFIPAVYAIIEGLEWLGVKKSIAHLIALPIGILVSFLVIPSNSSIENIIYGILIGLGAAGTCDTVGNCRQVMRTNKPSAKNKRIRRKK